MLQPSPLAGRRAAIVLVTCCCCCCLLPLSTAQSLRRDVPVLMQPQKHIDEKQKAHRRPNSHERQISKLLLLVAQECIPRPGTGHKHRNVRAYVVGADATLSAACCCKHTHNKSPYLAALVLLCSERDVAWPAGEGDHIPNVVQASSKKYQALKAKPKA